MNTYMLSINKSTPVLEQRFSFVFNANCCFEGEAEFIPLIVNKALFFQRFNHTNTYWWHGWLNPTFIKGKVTSPCGSSRMHYIYKRFDFIKIDNIQYISVERYHDGDFYQSIIWSNYEITLDDTMSINIGGEELVLW